MILNIKTSPELYDITLPAQKLIYTKHALARSVEKGLPVLNSLKIEKGQVVEAEPLANKIVARVSGILLDFDICLVLVLKHNGMLVLTTYKNHCNDRHL